MNCIVVLKIDTMPSCVRCKVFSPVPIVAVERGRSVAFGAASVITVSSVEWLGVDGMTSTELFESAASCMVDCDAGCVGVNRGTVGGEDSVSEYPSSSNVGSSVMMVTVCGNECVLRL